MTDFKVWGKKPVLFLCFLYMFIYNVLSPLLARGGRHFWRGGVATFGEGGRHFWRGGLLFSLALALAGCVTSPGSIRANSTAELPNIQDTYQDRFSQTERGMSLPAFRAVWPEALKSGETEEFTVYEFRDSILYHTDADYSTAFWWTGKAKNHEYLQRAIFFFAGDVLVKYETVVQVVEING